MNPTTTPQDVRVALLGLNIVRTLTVPARGRLSQELGTWGASNDFGVEVQCGSVCAASLAMWNRQFNVAHESVPLVGCEVP